jgi:hypothetical protein
MEQRRCDGVGGGGVGGHASVLRVNDNKKTNLRNTRAHSEAKTP